MTKDVLWLDDDARSLRVIRDLLRGRDFKITYADSVAAALAELKGKERFSTLILDAIVPMRRNTASDLEDSVGLEFLEDDELKGDKGEIVLGSTYADLERGGLVFQRLAKKRGVEFGKVVVVSYVPSQILSEMGYKFDIHISKPNLPDQLGHLARVIEDA